jgi:hypothetical protein
VLLYFCWSHDPGVLEDDDWCSVCVDILLMELVDCPTWQRQEVLKRLPPKLRFLLVRTEEDSGLVDEDDPASEELSSALSSPGGTLWHVCFEHRYANSPPKQRIASMSKLTQLEKVVGHTSSI